MGMTIDKILYSLHRDEVHREDDWFSTYSNVEVWEAGPTASKRRTMNDGEFVQYLKVRRSTSAESPQLIYLPGWNDLPPRRGQVPCHVRVEFTLHQFVTNTNAAIASFRIPRRTRIACN